MHFTQRFIFSLFLLMSAAQLLRAQPLEVLYAFGKIHNTSSQLPPQCGKPKT